MYVASHSNFVTGDGFTRHILNWPGIEMLILELSIIIFIKYWKIATIWHQISQHKSSSSALMKLRGITIQYGWIFIVIIMSLSHFMTASIKILAINSIDNKNCPSNIWHMGVFKGGFSGSIPLFGNFFNLLRIFKKNPLKFSCPYKNI